MKSELSVIKHTCRRVSTWPYLDLLLSHRAKSFSRLDPPYLQELSGAAISLAYRSAVAFCKSFCCNKCSEQSDLKTSSKKLTLYRFRIENTQNKDFCNKK